MSQTVPRLLVVLQPVAVRVSCTPRVLSIAKNQYDPSQGTRDIRLDPDIYVDQQDLFRFKEGAVVGLKYWGEFRVTLENDQPLLIPLETPPEHKIYYLHWISQTDSSVSPVRLYNDLFSVDDPMALDEPAFLSAVREDSLVTFPSARLPPGQYPPSTRYQFERLGYFSADHQGFNRIVPL